MVDSMARKTIVRFEFEAITTKLSIAVPDLSRCFATQTAIVGSNPTARSTTSYAGMVKRYDGCHKPEAGH